MTKLSEKEIKQLKKRYSEGERVLDLVKDFNISNGTLYKHVKDLKRTTKQTSEKISSSEESSSSEKTEESTTEETESSGSSEATEETEYSLSDTDLGTESMEGSSFSEVYDDNFSLSDKQFHINTPEEDVIKAPKTPKTPKVNPIPKRLDILEEKMMVPREQEPEVHEDPEERRKTIQMIRNYIEEFRPYLTRIIGSTPSEEKMYMERINSMKLEGIKTQLDEVQFAISNRSSGNMFKYAYFYGVGAIEHIGTNYFDLHLDNLSRDLARNQEIDLILKELSCMYSVHSWGDPKMKLCAITAFSILSVDSKNRLIESLQAERENKERGEKNQKEETEEEVEEKTEVEPTPEDKDEELLKHLNNFKV